MADHSQVAVYDDGMGTRQARCLGCSWTGPWRKKIEKTHEDAKAHSSEHLFNDRRRTDG